MKDRREFLKWSSLASLGLLLGVQLAKGRVLANGIEIPATYLPLSETDPYKLFSKHPDMEVLNDRPWNIESKAHLLDDSITPNEKMFIRNNGLIPEDVDPKTWTLTFDGEGVSNSKTYTLDALKSKFKHYTYQLTLECGGNGRKEFNPPAKGNQWGLGAVSCAEWTGVRLKDVLEDVGVKSNAVYIGYYGADVHLSRDPKRVVISRGVPMHKALEEETLLAFQMNGEDIPLAHGYPLRLVAGGWPASASGK